ncbi:MAG: ATP-grasp domain-containing protein [Liquorilactobacillus ghanensis]|uniref:ATP-grasp domain-containing protein n=1 Tax=Liquorilactobacillus ghanensis TaxID=399370 RepID=UPI0039EBD229
MNKKRVLIVEPSFYGVKFVEAAKNLGNEVIVIVSDRSNPQKYGYAASYDDLIVADIRDDNAIYQAIIKSPYANFAALIPATDYVTEVTAKVATRLGKFSNSVKATKRARNKDLAREQFAKNNVPSAKFQVVSDERDAKLAAYKIGYPLILKPTNTASSIDVFYIQNEAELQMRFEQIVKLKTSYMNFPVRHEYIMEEFLTGPEFSVELFLYQNQIAFSEVTEKHTTQPPFFVELEHIFPTTIEIEKKSEIINTAYQAAQALDFHDGPLHIEVKLTKNGPKIVEVNGRPGGDNITSDLVINAYGINIFEKTVQLYLHEKLSFKKTQQKFTATVFFFAQSKGILQKINGWNSMCQQSGVVRASITKRVGSFVRPPENSDDRIGYAILYCNTLKELQQAINKVKSLVTLTVI